MAQSDSVWREKGVDVKIATDMVSLAYRDLYDAAILVSGDGDLAPAVQEIRRIGRIVENARLFAPNRTAALLGVTPRIEKKVR